MLYMLFSVQTLLKINVYSYNFSIFKTIYIWKNLDFEYHIKSSLKIFINNFYVQRTYRLHNYYFNRIKILYCNIACLYIMLKKKGVEASFENKKFRYKILRVCTNSFKSKMTIRLHKIKRYNHHVLSYTYIY